MDLPATPLSPKWGWLPLTRTSRATDIAPATPRKVPTASRSVDHPLPPVPQDLSPSYLWDESLFMQADTCAPSYGLDSAPFSLDGTYSPTGSELPTFGYTIPDMPVGVAGDWPIPPASLSSITSSPDAGSSWSSIAPRYSRTLPEPKMLSDPLLVGPSAVEGLTWSNDFDFTLPPDAPEYPSAPALAPLQTLMQNAPLPDAVQHRPAKKARSLPPASAESLSKAGSSSIRSSSMQQFVRRRRNEALAAKLGAKATSRKRKHREENDENAPPAESDGQQADEGDLVLWDLFRKKEVQCNRKQHCRFRARGCPWTFDEVKDLKRHEDDRSHFDDRMVMKCAPVMLYHCPWPGCDYASQRDYCLKAHWKAITRGCVAHLIEDPRWPYKSLEDLHRHLREYPAYFQCPEF
ncbi:uncharacterized protein LAESUDRAFT_814402 [Laetiporus sulphureus 93-53]|uniref:Uncharacterized protein n=1 Tax=Laetiporus sulphureus 93-53 TaxID=1314785 RepID=A0A165CY95_9APHY|nr:uncharacterized protein LAESUDRAFT_814402 [Laetiporus sulphureus 93-53]KZT03731.1 hypothetical protein LAESUDRAFT_814402 [Laetiporus sulphureus 93-53]